jgi:3-deoxy-manno-octulosonate cytidylyltransferase (CMP-KDO synthetase)
MSAVGIIPARFRASRFPGKPLAKIAGRPMIAHVIEGARRSKRLREVIVATDDERIAAVAATLGAPVAMTSPAHATGTDRIAEAAAQLSDAIIVNVQGDEPLIDPETIDATIRALLSEPEIPMATARHRIADPIDVADPNRVKVVCDLRGRALYFSRSPIPAVRDAGPFAYPEGSYWQHVGLYAYRRAFLLEYARMAPTPLEKLEKLEQLRVLENGYAIAVVNTDYRSIGVDTPQDLERVRAALAEVLDGRERTAEIAEER